MVFAVIKVCIKHLNMAKKKMFSEEEINEIISTYLSGKSCPETGKIFGVSGSSIHYILKKHNIPRRSVSTGNVIKWEDEGFRENQIKSKRNKPWGATGKTRNRQSIKKSRNKKWENNSNRQRGNSKRSSNFRS